MTAHIVPKAWLDEAGVSSFTPTRVAFRAGGEHMVVPIADIEPPRRREGVILDENGFRKDRMMKILIGIREDYEIPPIFVEVSDGPHKFRLRDGVHRFYASIACGFTAIPVDIVERL